MTQQKLIEIVKKQFPNTGETEIRERLNDANKYFLRESRIIQDTVSISIPEGQTEFSFSDLKNEHGGHLIEVMSVEDSDESREFAWLVRDRDVLVVGKYEYHDRIVPAEAGKIVHILGTYTDPGFTSDLTAEPRYDSEFHLATAHYVLSDLWLEEGNLNKAQAYENKYKKLEVAAKRAAGSKGIQGNYKSFRGLDPYARD